MGYDPIYICHFYYIIENIAASSNDTRLVINCSLNIGEDKHNTLGFRGNGNYYILGSVDSKHMVKSLFTSQIYITWSNSLSFTSNQSRNFGTKVIRQWLKKICLEG